MTSRHSALSGERRVVTALFCDVVGSTSIAEEMDPEDWGELLGEAITTMGNVVARYGGTIPEFGGDGMVALFGAPIAHEDDPYRAVRAGLDIIDAMRQAGGSDGHRLEVRVGIHTGLAVVGDIEAGALSTYSALGDTLNVAARLQALAEPGSVVISDQTRRLLGGDIDARSLGPMPLKGREASVVVHEVLDVKEFDERRRGITGVTSPMVGRRSELDSLERATAMSAAGTGRVVAVVGEPGVGKSRLIAELGRGRADADGLWAVGACVPYDDELPYHLVGSLIRSLAGVAGSESNEVIGKGIDDLAERVGVGEHGATLKRLIGLEGDYEEETADQLRDEYSAALISVIAALARSERPIVLVCEDVHWADASSVDLMSELLVKVPTLPLMMLLLLRPDRGTPGWSLLETGRRELADSFTEISLRPLDDASSQSLVSNLLEIESLPPTLRRLVLDKAEGNPFFLEEVIRMLIESGLVENRDGRWVASRDSGSLEVPETIQGLLASRIDLLEPDLRHAGRVAAVIGRRFSAGLFDAVYDTTSGGEGTLHPHLAGLEARGMIRLEEIEPELEFGFRHALIHDVMYQGLLRRERRDIHEDVATAIERLYPDRLPEMAPALARHYAEAGVRDKATSYFLVAGDRALAQGARVEAARFFGHAQELLEEDESADPTELVDAVIGRVTAGMGFTPGPESIRWIESVLPIAESLDDPDRLAHLYERLIWTRSMQGESHASPEYREQLDAGYSLIPRLTDQGTAALLHAMMGGALRSNDEYEASVEPLTKAVDGLEDEGRLSEASYNASMLADSLSQIGRFDEAIAAIERATELGERSGDPNTVLDAEIIRGSIASDRGDLEEALEYTRRGIEGAEAHGNTFCNLAANFKLADQKLRLGDVGSAIDHLERSTGLAQYCNAGGYEVLGQAWLAMARSRAGEFRVEDFEAPLANAIQSGSRSSEALVRLRRAIALAESGDIERASPDFERAIELFDDYGGLPNLGRAHHAYGQALEAAGRIEDAASHLRAAEEIFSDLGIRADPVTTNRGSHERDM